MENCNSFIITSIWSYQSRPFHPLWFGTDSALQILRTYQRHIPHWNYSMTPSGRGIVMNILHLRKIVCVLAEHSRFETRSNIQQMYPSLEVSLSVLYDIICMITWQHTYKSNTFYQQIYVIHASVNSPTLYIW